MQAFAHGARDHMRVFLSGASDTSARRTLQVFTHGPGRLTAQTAAGLVSQFASKSPADGARHGERNGLTSGPTALRGCRVDYFNFS